MTRLLVTLALPLLAVGCIDVDFHLRETPARSSAHPPEAAAPITADRVTPANARRMAEALWNEIDREEMAPMVALEKRK